MRGAFPRPPPEPGLRRGDEGPAVTAAQAQHPAPSVPGSLPTPSHTLHQRPVSQWGAGSSAKG